MVHLVEKCLRRKPESRPSAREIFEILSGLLPDSNRARPFLPTTRRTALPPVAEVDHGGISSGSYQSKFSIRPLENFDYMDVSTWSGSEPHTSSGPDPQTTSGEGSRRLSTLVEDPINSGSTLGEGSGPGRGGSEGVAYEGRSGEERAGSGPVEEKADSLGEEKSALSAVRGPILIRGALMGKTC